MTAPATPAQGEFVKRAMELANALADAGVQGWSTPDHVVAERTEQAEEALRAHLSQQAALTERLAEALTGVIGWVPGRHAWHTDAPTQAVERARSALAAYREGAKA